MSSGERLSPAAVVAVAGAGTMGAGIARVAAAAGHPVLLFDVRPGAAAAAVAAIAADEQQRVERGKSTRAAMDALLERLQVGGALEDLAPAQLVIEAIVEDRAAKVALFGALEAIVGDETILATNTSSISVTAIAGGLRRPERCVGMHFFNPAQVMKLVEIVRPLAAGDRVVRTAAATAEAWGKRALIVPSTPGFVVNRVARPFYAEALRSLAAPAACIDVDAALTECGGFRMGPFALMDLIGNDINAAVTRSVFEGFGFDRRFAPSLAQQALVDAGRFGRKAGRGFYDYAAGAALPVAAELPPAPPPASVVAYGDLGVAEALLALAQERGVAVRREAGDQPHIDVDGIALQLSDGSLAAERARLRPTVLFDLALDYAAASRAVIAGVSTGDPALAVAAGFFQALGKRVSVAEDVPGLFVMRTVAAIVNEATSMLVEGMDEDGVDLAMTLGTNYPLGPIAWGRRIGWTHVLHVLEQLSRLFGPERYTPTPVLRRFALAEARTRG